MTTTEVPPVRYSWGGDEYLFAEVEPEMSLRANFRAMAITSKLQEARPEGLLEVCPANASYQIRFDPDVIDPWHLLDRLKALEVEVGAASDFPLQTRIVEIPTLYQDPWTHETLMRFRDSHQDPDGTDIEYAARINGYPDVESFIAAHSGAPWFVSMVGFAAGLPFMYQMVPRDRQIVVPKYLRPRTDTPKQTVGYGGCFGCIYSVRGAGGYQMFGITPAPIYDPAQQKPDLAEFLVFCRPGDIISYRPIDRDEYDELEAKAQANQYRIRQRPVEFNLRDFLEDADRSNARLLEVLHAD